MTLAAAGRNPTDIPLPTVGSQASGSGKDEEDAVSTSVTTAAASSGGTTPSEPSDGTTVTASDGGSSTASGTVGSGTDVSGSATDGAATASTSIVASASSSSGTDSSQADGGMVQAQGDPPAQGSNLTSGWCFGAAYGWVADKAQWTLEVGSAGGMGVGQGALNTVNGVQGGVVGTVNLIPKTFNAVSGCRAMEELPSPDRSNGVLVAEDPSLHNASKFLGGTGVDDPTGESGRRLDSGRGDGGPNQPLASSSRAAIC